MVFSSVAMYRFTDPRKKTKALRDELSAYRPHARVNHWLDGSTRAPSSNLVAGYTRSDKYTRMTTNVVNIQTPGSGSVLSGDPLVAGVVHRRAGRRRGYESVLLRASAPYGRVITSTRGSIARVGSGAAPFQGQTSSVLLRSYA